MAVIHVDTSEIARLAPQLLDPPFLGPHKFRVFRPVPGQSIGAPYRIFEKHKEDMADTTVLWSDTGFCAYGYGQARKLKDWLVGENPDYEFLISR